MHRTNFTSSSKLVENVINLVSILFDKRHNKHLNNQIERNMWLEIAEMEGYDQDVAANAIVHSKNDFL